MEEKQLQINLTPDVAEGTYSNMAVISHSPEEFFVDFVRLVPGVEQANVMSRIIMTPANAKKLLFALQENVKKYEQQFGTIQLKTNPIPGSTMPMSFGGEA